MTTTTQTQRGQCPACGRKIALRKDGTLRYHTVPRQWGTGSGVAPYCDGWGEPPLAEEPTP